MTPEERRKRIAQEEGLHDTFALAALIGILAGSEGTGGRAANWWWQRAEEAYLAADAMLMVRRGKNADDRSMKFYDDVKGGRYKHG